MRRSLALLLLASLVACGGDPPGPAVPAPAGAAALEGWTRLPDGPLSGRVGATLAALDEHQVLVVGGWAWLCPPTAGCALPDLPLLADAAVVDLRTGRWRAAADAPFGLRHAAATSVDGDAYLLSGCRRAPSCEGAPELVRYDARADRWSQLASLPERGWYGQLLPVGDGLVALASTEERGGRADYSYDPEADVWQPLPDDPLDRPYDRFGVLDGDRLLLLGSSARRNRKEVAALDLRTRTWSRLPDAPGLGYQAWRAGDEVWLNPHFGAEGGGVLDLGTDTWRSLPPLPTGEREPWDLAGVVGVGAASYQRPDGWVRDTRTDRWLRVPDRPGGELEQSVTAAGDALVVFGGTRWPESTASEGGELLAETWLWRPPPA